MIGLLLLATGEKYQQYIEPLVASAKKYFPPHETLLWSDRLSMLTTRTFIKSAEGYPNETLMRYHTFLDKEAVLKQYDHLFYCDADMLFVDYVKEEDIVSKGLTATLHPGYVGKIGTPEIRQISTAYCPNNTAYYCGGFQGGTAKAYLGAANLMAGKIDADAKNGVTAIWHDESHWNALLANRPPERILTPEYCYPENAGEYYKNIWRNAGMEIKPKIVAITKKGPR